MERDFTRVAIMCATDNEYPRGVIAGVRRFATADKGWVFAPFGANAEGVHQVREFDPHGIIAQVGGRRTRDALIEYGRVTVNVSARRTDVPFPRVGVDDHGIGEMAARYFLERGYRHAAYLGLLSVGIDAYVIPRFEGFRGVMEEAGVTVTDDGASAAGGADKWLMDLPKPTCLLAANDGRGMFVLHRCRALGLRVPEDIAVVGVDNDVLLCELTYPPLSSVATNAVRVGYEAAALLDRLLKGEAAPTKHILIPPTGVVTRQSSDALAVHDPAVLEAMRYIWQNIERGINVEDVARQLAVSRRWLEHVFKRSLHRTPGEEIRRVRLTRAKELLASTDLPMPEIARRVGFSDARRLSVSFRSELLTTPTAFRRQSRAGDATAER